MPISLALEPIEWILGSGCVAVGLACVLYGALTATKWIDEQSDRDLFTLAFLSQVVAPLLGGGILLVMGLMELL